MKPPFTEKQISLAIEITHLGYPVALISETSPFNSEIRDSENFLRQQAAILTSSDSLAIFSEDEWHDFKTFNPELSERTVTILEGDFTLEESNLLNGSKCYYLKRISQLLAVAIAISFAFLALIALNCN